MFNQHMNLPLSVWNAQLNIWVHSFESIKHQCKFPNYLRDLRRYSMDTWKDPVPRLKTGGRTPQNAHVIARHAVDRKRTIDTHDVMWFENDEPPTGAENSEVTELATALAFTVNFMLSSTV